MNLIRVIYNNLNLQTLSIIAIILSPTIAVVIGEFLRKRNFKKQKRLDALYALVAYRYKVDSDEFLKALNSLKLFFYKDKILIKLLNELFITFQKRDKGEETLNTPEQLITKIIKKVCTLEGFKNITEEDLNNLFKKK